MMPDSNIDAVACWAMIHQEQFIVYVWVDYETCGVSKEELEKYYNDRIKNFVINENRLAINNIAFKDITTDLYNAYSEKEFYKYVKYEINRLRPNYGISSDILRYKILYEYGGIYFDSDIDPGNNNLIEINNYFCEESYTHLLFVDNFSQDHTEGIIGNDAFMSTTKNPLMRLFLKRAIDSYQKCNHSRYKNLSEKEENKHFCLECEQSVQVNLKYYDDKEHILMYTVGATGPKMIRSVIADEIAKTEQLDNLVANHCYEKNLNFKHETNFYILPIKEGLELDIKICINDGINNYETNSHTLTFITKFRLIHPKLRQHNRKKEPKRSCCWLNIPLTKDMSCIETENRIINSSLFELQEMGIFRLSDNILNYYEISQQKTALSFFTNLMQFLKEKLNHEKLNDLKIQLLRMPSIQREIDTSFLIGLNDEQAIKQRLSNSNITTTLKCILW